jgi:hypothetical protein
MKLTSLLFAAMAAYTQADDSQRGLATLAQKWNISDPTFVYNSLTFTLAFGVSDYIKRDLDMVKYTVWDENCDTAEGVPLWPAAAGNGITSVTNDTATSLMLSVGGVPSGGDSMSQDVGITIAIDSATVSANSNIYTEDTTVGAVTAEIRFCVRFELHTPKYLATVVEVNLLETLVTLSVDLSDGFEIGSIAVEPKDRLVRTANQVYRVRGYQCGVNEVELTEAEAAATRVQGSVIKVCVTPDEEATADGIYMRSIDSFSFNRDVGVEGATPVVQVAVLNKVEAANLLTTYSNAACTGTLVCHFSTILFANFYTSVGSVDGAGIASMQFGDASGRRLRLGDRNLQDDAAAAAEFELQFGVEAITETPSGASSIGIGAMLMTGLIALSGVAASLM